jgi:prolyl 4-hydroxylase
MINPGQPEPGKPREHLKINVSYPGVKQVHANPPVFTVENFISPEECAWLMETSSGLMTRAPVVTRGTTKEASGTNEIRTASTCFLSREEMPSIYQKLEECVGKPREHCELLQIGRYCHGQFYREHYDSVDPNSVVGQQFCANGGNRVATVLMYLNEVPEGGCTYFSQLDLRIKPVAGMALIFFPAFEDGTLDLTA